MQDTLKNEIRFALAWAVTFAMDNKFVIIPGILKKSPKGFNFPKHTVILNGRNIFSHLSEREAEAAKMAFLFSMERRELADELTISDDYSYGLISSLYEKVGLNDILSGEVELENYFKNHPLINQYLGQKRNFVNQLKNSNAKNENFKKKIKNKETLAFHLMTFSEIDEIYK